nr:putative uncharacterized protein C5orf66 homolog isoform X5 [Macaca nemestrina]XP_024644065.1 putative uncharacterized protein C5orf66 homolog isoform X5 [Macaca nemestrina]XP_024644066.1 putative uncharacterized protein C5orf66 homolog isoform X5 [Macaca nemestrina]XP_024644067.1 putative uncharacterized protein C5orf66 homolog isoform X5 [Macaca nemestrina]XP_024644068.1 putative uncharacterized protein C5orf66 homolog isoform X5 [Macaca nemestrina]
MGQTQEAAHGEHSQTWPVRGDQEHPHFPAEETASGEPRPTARGGTAKQRRKQEWTSEPALLCPLTALGRAQSLPHWTTCGSAALIFHPHQEFAVSRTNSKSRRLEPVFELCQIYGHRST